MRLALLAVTAFALAACQPQDAGNLAANEAGPTPEEMGQDDPDAPATPDPEVNPVTFEAMSRTAEAFTGAITLQAIPRAGPNAAPAMKLTAASGLVYETELAPGAANQPAIDWSVLFNTPVDLESPTPDMPTIDIHIVTSETIPPGLANGGLCGADPTFAIAMAAPIGSPSGSHIGLAAFKGTQWPPTEETALCGTFNYMPPA